MNNISIIGTGGFAREVFFLIEELGMEKEVVGFFEPDNVWETSWKDKMIMEKPVLPYSDFNPKKGKATIGIGNSKIREKIITELPGDTEFISLIHPNASVSKWVKLGEGCIITAGCIVTTQITIGNHCHLNLGTTIGHDCSIGNFFTTAPSVNISGDCKFGNHVYFGTGAATRQGVSICDNVTIGMGAMVVKNINESGIYVGIPAKKRP